MTNLTYTANPLLSNEDHLVPRSLHVHGVRDSGVCRNRIVNREGQGETE